MRITHRILIGFVLPSLFTFAAGAYARAAAKEPAQAPVPAATSTPSPAAFPAAGSDDPRFKPLVLASLRPGFSERILEIIFIWENAEHTARDDFHLFVKVNVEALVTRRESFGAYAVGLVLRFRAGNETPAPEPFYRSTARIASEDGNVWRLWFEKSLYFEWDRLKSSTRGMYSSQARWISLAQAPTISVRDWSTGAVRPAPGPLPVPMPLPLPFPNRGAYYPNPYAAPYPPIPMPWQAFPTVGRWF